MAIFKAVLLYLKLYLIGNFLVVFVLAKSVPSPHEVLFSWKQIDYKFPNSNIKEKFLLEGEYIPENNVITGIKVHQNRIFLTVPRWREGVPSTLNFVDFNVTQEPSNSPLIPYPSWEFQELGNCTAIQYVQSMEIDQFGRMWVVDVGRVNTFTNPDNSCPPKLLLIDLATDEVIKEHIFPHSVVNHTKNFLNDIVVGCKNIQDENNCYAYISDADDSKLVMYNLMEDRSWFVTHETMIADPSATVIPILDGNYTFNTNIDGIALSPFDSNFDRVYYSPLSSFQLYSVLTSVLNEAVNGAILNDSQVITHGRTSGQSDGMAMDAVGNIYYGILSNNSVVYSNTTTEQIDETTEVLLVQDDVELQWVDTFAFDEEGYIYMTSNRLHRFSTETYDFSQDNFRVVRVFVGSKSYMYSAL
ncbi:unnamed protein product [Orchesella dallaii]|uniref:Protein yellow n=1 Tax=Orchesella dallaii TaxID=48710 RepID=A0ABP1S7B1_9HEXA